MLFETPIWPGLLCLGRLPLVSPSFATPFSLRLGLWLPPCFSPSCFRLHTICGPVFWSLSPSLSTYIQYLRLTSLGTHHSTYLQSSELKLDFPLFGPIRHSSTLPICAYATSTNPLPCWHCRSCWIGFRFFLQLPADPGESGFVWAPPSFAVTFPGLPFRPVSRSLLQLTVNTMPVLDPFVLSLTSAPSMAHGVTSFRPHPVPRLPFHSPFASDNFHSPSHLFTMMTSFALYGNKSCLRNRCQTLDRNDRHSVVGWCVIAPVTPPRWSWSLASFRLSSLLGPVISTSPPTRLPLPHTTLLGLLCFGFLVDPR